MKTEITTLDELNVFSTLMKELLIELPFNVKITVHLKKDDYNKIVPEEKRDWEGLEYTSDNGLRLYLAKEK